MSWRQEKTGDGYDYVFDGLELGIAPSALKGTANIQNANISTELGQVMASFGRVAQQQAAISGGTLTPDGATLFDAPSTLKGGQWIKVTASTVTGITATTNPTTVSVSYLAVGGGGGGGGAINDAAGGGGGAGEVLTGSTSLSVGTKVITVGAGGAAGSSGPSAGTTGGNSVIAGVITANGGGGGGAGFTGGSAGSHNGKNGGNGGGGGASSGVSGTAGVGDQFNGGVGSGTAGEEAGGGGGGAGEVGEAGSATVLGKGGDGGDGIASSITGASVTYGGGGGGGHAATSDDSPGQGGAGGGGRGGLNGNNPGLAGTDGLGGGGGGGSADPAGSAAGGAGGSGLVVISYVTGSAVAIGGTVTQTATHTIHTFTEDGIFEVIAIGSDGLYFVSFKNTSNKIKLSTTFDPYGLTPITTHGTTGTVTFDILATVNQPLAKATERYYTTTGTEYRYYILDLNSRVWVYDTQVYDSTLLANGVGITWMLPDPTDYSNVDFTGMGILNGWLVLLNNEFILLKPTVLLGKPLLFMTGGFLTNPYPNHRNFVLTGTQGTLVYTDGNFLGEIYPTTSFITSLGNVQSYAQYTAVTTVGTISNLIGGTIPFVTGADRLPVVFFSSGALPTAITANTVYWVEYSFNGQTFEVYSASTGGSALDIQTGATGNQYYNTFYPIGADAGADGTNPTVQFTPQRVILPFYEKSTCLVEVGNTVLIGCEGYKVYPWNQVDAVPSDVINLPEANVRTMLNVNNIAYIFAGNKGNIYISNGVVASLALKIPDYCAGVPGTVTSYIEPYFTWGDADYVRGRVYCSILDQTATKAGNCGGIWSFVPSENVDPAQAIGNALRLENQNSYADYDGYAPIILASQEQDTTAPQYWAAWQDSYNTATANFGIDFTNPVPVTTYVIETDLLATGTILDKTTFQQLEYKLATPLASGDSVQLYWRLNATNSWTSAGTVVEETADKISGYFQTNFQKTQWVQIRGVVTTGGTMSSSFVPLTQIRLR